MKAIIIAFDMLVLLACGSPAVKTQENKTLDRSSSVDRAMVFLEGAKGGLLPGIDSTVITGSMYANDSGLYLKDQASGLWYVRGTTAMRVKGADGHAVIFDGLWGIQASPFGGLYLHPRKHEGIWYVRSGVAVPVREVETSQELDSLVGPVSPVTLTIGTGNRSDGEFSLYE